MSMMKICSIFYIYVVDKKGVGSFGIDNPFPNFGSFSVFIL